MISRTTRACGEALQRAARTLEGVAATAVDTFRLRRRAADLRTLADLVCAYVMARPRSLRAAPDALIVEGAAAVDRLEPYMASISAVVQSDDVDLRGDLIPALEAEVERRAES